MGGNSAFMKKRTNRPAVSGAAGIIAIIVVGIFMLCVIFLIAKGLFSSNSSEVPSGLNTATLNTNTELTTALPESTAETVSTQVTPESQTSSEASSETAQEGSGETMYVLEYAYLHVSPDNESENIICLSPGVVVTILGQEENGYVKISFQNIDGPMSGYVYKDYLTTEYVQPAWGS